MKVSPALVLSIVVVLALGIFLAMTVKRVEREVELPPGPQALSNRYLAAERFLGEMGLPAEGVARLGELPPTDAVLVLAIERRITKEVEAWRLADWVSAGGFLIFTGPNDSGEVFAEGHFDPLADVFGVYTTRAPGMPNRQLETVHLTKEAPLLEVQFYDTLGVGFWEGEEGYETGNGSIAWDAYGAGYFALICDLEFLENSEIGLHDHAAFTWELLGLAGERTEALIVRGQRYESFLATLMRSAWLPLSALGLCLAAWGWRAGQQLGPKIPDDPPSSRSIVEHVEANGRFLWRLHCEDKLLDASRADLLRRIALRRPALADANEDELCAALAEETGFFPSEVQQLLFGVCPHKREAFVSNVEKLERLRRTL